MSIDILAGFAGRTPLGHGAIFGISTYVVIYGPLRLGLPPRPGCCSAVRATTLAAVFALLAIRTSGVYFLLLTLALGMIVWGVCLRWTSVTGGENGLRGDCAPAPRRPAPSLRGPARGRPAHLSDVALRQLALRAHAAGHPG